MKEPFTRHTCPSSHDSAAIAPNTSVSPSLNSQYPSDNFFRLHTREEIDHLPFDLRDGERHYEIYASGIVKGCVGTPFIVNGFLLLILMMEARHIERMREHDHGCYGCSTAENRAVRDYIAICAECNTETQGDTQHLIRGKSYCQPCSRTVVL